MHRSILLSVCLSFRVATRIFLPAPSDFLRVLAIHDAANVSTKSGAKLAKYWNVLRARVRISTSSDNGAISRLNTLPLVCDWDCAEVGAEKGNDS